MNILWWMMMDWIYGLNLDNLNIRSIVRQRNLLFRSLSNSTILTLQEVEDTIRTSLDIYATIVESKSTADFDPLIDKLIQHFQRFVVQHKTTQHITDMKEGEEKELDKNSNKTLVDHLLDDVKEKANDVETDHDDFVEKQSVNTTSIETVIKVKDSDMNMLIDSANNKYVLSKSGDITSSSEDMVLLNDISTLMIACVSMVVVMYFIRLPSFFGSVVGGIVMSQNKWIVHPVQVETISKLGVMFIMFFLGLEFSIQKVKRVWGIAFFGSFLLLSTTLGICIGVGKGVFEATIPESMVIGACLFLSSTAVVVHLLNAKELELGYGRSIMGILVCQVFFLNRRILCLGFYWL
jgi:hypothetical protein